MTFCDRTYETKSTSWIFGLILTFETFETLTSLAILIN